MVKKLLTALLTAVILLSAGLPANAFAAEVSDFAEQENIFRYEEMKNVMTDLKIEGKNAKAGVMIIKKDNNKLNYVKVKLSIVSNATGRAVKTWNATLYPNSDGNFETVKNYTLTARGTYHAECSGEAYDKDNNLLDTFNISSKNATY